MDGYVQDERYTAGAGMRRSGASQFCTLFGAGMRRSGACQICTARRVGNSLPTRFPLVGTNGAL